MNFEDIVESARGDGFSVVPELDAQGVLKTYGVTCPPTALVTTRADCLEAAARMGYPVVLKVHSRQIVHKSDVGGVITGIDTPEMLNQAYGTLLANVAARCPGALVSGVIVQKQMAKGIEIVVGALKDGQCGPVVMVGLGGVYVEVFKDVSFRLAPLDRDEALRQLKETKAFKLLSGVRGQESCNIDRLCDIIVSASRIISEEKTVNELDFNPVLCYRDECVVVDARIVI